MWPLRRRPRRAPRPGVAGVDRPAQPQSPQRDAAIAALHALLLKAARFEVDRRRAAFPHLRGDDFDDLAQQSADDALVAVLSKLDDFRGDSRFTTWAYKFALLEAGVKVRRRAWQGREVPLEPESWALIAARRRDAAGGRRDGRAVRRACRTRSNATSARTSARSSSPSRSTTSRSTSSPSGSTRPAARSTRPSTTPAASSEPRSPIAASAPADTEAERHDPTRPRPRLLDAAPRTRRPRADLRAVLRGARPLRRARARRRADADEQVPGMRAHLEGCPACAEDHESLLAFVASEQYVGQVAAPRRGRSLQAEAGGLRVGFGVDDCTPQSRKRFSWRESSLEQREELPLLVTNVRAKQPPQPGAPTPTTGTLQRRGAVPDLRMLVAHTPGRSGPLGVVVRRAVNTTRSSTTK